MVGLDIWMFYSKNQLINTYLPKLNEVNKQFRVKLGEAMEKEEIEILTSILGLSNNDGGRKNLYVATL